MSNSNNDQIKDDKEVYYSMLKKLLHDSAKESEIYLKENLPKLLGDGWVYNIGIREIIGDVFIVDVIYLGDKEDTRLNRLNAFPQLRTMMHLSESRGEPTTKIYIEAIGHTRLPQGVRFRKINAKQWPIEAAKKLFKWFEKNKESLTNFKKVIGEIK